MKKIYLTACTLCTFLGASAQEVVWQKDLKSSTQDFLSQVTTTIDQQYLITGSSIQAGSGKREAGGWKTVQQRIRFPFGKTQPTR